MVGCHKQSLGKLGVHRFVGHSVRDMVRRIKRHYQLLKSINWAHELYVRPCAYATHVCMCASRLCDSCKTLCCDGCSPAIYKHALILAKRKIHRLGCRSALIQVFFYPLSPGPRALPPPHGPLASLAYSPPSL